MAEFCEACNRELFNMESDFKGLTSEKDWEEGKAAVVLCEGCGSVRVDPEGCCVSKDCLKAGQTGHGYPEWRMMMLKNKH